MRKKKEKSDYARDMVHVEENEASPSSQYQMSLLNPPLTPSMIAPYVERTDAGMETVLDCGAPPTQAVALNTAVTALQTMVRLPHAEDSKV